MNSRRRRTLAQYFLLILCAAGCADGTQPAHPRPSDAGTVDAGNRVDGGAPIDGSADANADGAPTDSGLAIEVDASPALDAGSGERCGNGFDDDGNGLIDEGCACASGATQFCFPGSPAEATHGSCRVGTQTCMVAGEFSSWSECVGAVGPAADVCGDGLDQDCNGVVDDGAACCAEGTSETCYDGPAGTAGVGVCRAGSRLCASGAFGVCAGQLTPSAEVCGNSADDNCNGSVDEGCVCTPSTSRICYPYDSAQIGHGVCRSGTETCDASGTGYGACAGYVGPSTEVCGNSVDDNCDGNTDEGCVTCAPGPVTWPISAAEMASGASDPTGAGACSGTAYCTGSTCYTTPPGGCGSPHCATLRYGDGRTHLDYCSVRAICTAAGIVATGFTW